MPAWPANGETDWNTAMRNCLGSEHSLTTGMHKAKCCQIYLTTNQENIPSETSTKVTLNTIGRDPQSWADIANNKITPTESGYYYVYGQARFINTLSGKLYRTYIYKNNAIACGSMIHSSIASSFLTVNVASILYLDGNDYIDLRVYHNDGAGTSDIEDGIIDTYLICFKLGDI